MTRVALLWHMHQPFYVDVLTGEHVLPWVRLHALKDYWGMVALLREFPRVKATFNLVPSLLVQLEAFASGAARDRHLDIGLKAADQLNDEERAFCVAEFFHAQRQRMIDPYPRYRELLDRRGNGGLSPRSQAAQFSTDDLRDLQVWHKLVWIDPWYHDHDPRVQALLGKGRGFSEEDKAALREVEVELLRRVVPEYAGAAERGQVELSTSPFYHPILPLLCDSDVYLRTHPQSRMPREPFRHPEDAREQLARAAAFHEKLFGHRPVGVWPSEGSVSDAMVPLVAETGLRWMATDEEILARTLGSGFGRDGDGQVEHPERLYRPYLIAAGGKNVACGFRDHALSDLIGFMYASWSADGAADDFVYRLVNAGRRFAARTSGEEATIFVVLDGENAWEHYDRQGRPFLRALYARLSAHPEIRTVTMAEACTAPRETLSSIFPGSWINGDFYIWMGHPDDHRAWSQLAEARRTLDAAAGAAPATAVDRAREEMLIAEGSDWFWWYGDDHSSEHDREFDQLFRRHVRNVYRALDRPIPEELFVSNISTQPAEVALAPLTGFINPVLDGQVTSYFEWIGAGRAEAAADVGGTMHNVSDGERVIAAVEFGFSQDFLFVRLEGRSALEAVFEPDVEVRLKFLVPAGVHVVVDAVDASGPGVSAGGRRIRGVRSRLEIRDPREGVWRTQACPEIGVGLGRILEIRVPFRCLEGRGQTQVAFVVTVSRRGADVEQHPQHGPIEVPLPDPSFAAKNWTV